MKESFYFPHDSNASQDPKMMILLSECGLAGVGMYWVLVEILHQQEDGRIKKEAYKQYIKFYCGEKGGTGFLDKIEQVLNTCGLLLNKDGFIYSERVLQNKKYRENISKQRSLAGKKSAEARAKPTSVEQNLTSVEQGKERKGKERKTKEIKESIYMSDSDEYRLAILLANKILENNPSHKFSIMEDDEFDSKMQGWAKHMDLLMRKDRRTFEQVEIMIKWCQNDSFWQANILSPSKLRDQFDTLIAQCKRGGNKNKVIKIS